MKDSDKKVIGFSGLDGNSDNRMVDPDSLFSEGTLLLQEEGPSVRLDESDESDGGDRVGVSFSGLDAAAAAAAVDPDSLFTDGTLLPFSDEESDESPPPPAPPGRKPLLRAERPVVRLDDNDNDGGGGSTDEDFANGKVSEDDDDARRPLHREERPAVSLGGVRGIGEVGIGFSGLDSTGNVGAIIADIFSDGTVLSTSSGAGQGDDEEDGEDDGDEEEEEEEEGNDALPVRRPLVRDDSPVVRLNGAGEVR